MTHTALAQVQPFATWFRASILRQSSCPCDIIGIDIENSGFRVESRSTPFCATVESGEHHGILADTKRNKLSLVTKLSEVFQRPLMSLDGAAGQHVFRENLTRKGRRSGRKRLFHGSDFARHRARGILTILERKEPVASGALE